MQNGWVISLFVLLPNFLLFIYPPGDVPPTLVVQKSKGLKYVEILERIGKAACFTIPFFYSLRFDTTADWIFLAVALFALLFYYACWLRYAFGGRSFHLLFEPLAGVPIPMAIAPVLVFLMASLNLQSWPMGIAVIMLAAGHLPISWNEWKRC